jgi:hypothetical protein
VDQGLCHGVETVTASAALDRLSHGSLGPFDLTESKVNEG